MVEKLVRDKIPEIIRATGHEPRFRQAAEGERLGLLVKKLHEEAGELQVKPCLEECADVLEVLLAIAAELGVTREELFRSGAAKAVERGGFQKGYVLEVPGESQ